LSQSLQPSEHIIYLEKKLVKFKKMALINRLQGATTQKLIYLWIVFAESILGYGGFIFSLEGLNETVKE
jgi:hypothetical protein